MDRQRFLSSLLPLTIGVKGIARQLPPAHPAARNTATPVIHIPPYLQPGDIVGITCPAGYIENEEIQPAIQQIKSWGFNVVTGSTIGKRDFTYGGTDEERLQDMQTMLDDPSVKAILCARGGYGAVRIIDRLRFANFLQHPKWIIGFSDITVLHSHVHQQLHTATIHSKMCNSFPQDWSKASLEQQATILSIKEALIGSKMLYETPSSVYNVAGKATGILVGGNLRTLENLTGSKSDIDTAGKILFVEDTGEYPYSIDRMFWNLYRTGKLKHLAGLIVGGFKIKEDVNEEPFGRTLYEIVSEKIQEYHYPVCFDFPVGHQKNNYALKCGVEHSLEVGTDKVILKEKGASKSVTV